MKKYLLSALLFIAITQVKAQSSAIRYASRLANTTDNYPPGSKPGQRYFGLHFDFHAESTDSLIGRNLSAQSLDSLLTAVKPDFIQVDCKGHPGVTSYPSKVPDATVANHFINDPLRFYREVTRKHGVDLYLHYSGVKDHAVLAKHPDWGVMHANGERDKMTTSVHSAYVDSLMIPQLKEIADYGADGVWVDGDCWDTKLDYAPIALAAFKTETGSQTVPRTNTEPNYEAFRMFARRSFVTYMGHYIDELHRYNPTFRVASNWAYSSMMPEPITTPVDYLSGDLTPGNSVNTAALEARILAAQGQLYQKPWDLMSWSFWYQFGPPMKGDQKTAVHLMQEAAEVIALGGGFQAYFLQRRDASISLDELPAMVGLSQFVRARQPFCQGSVPIPQIALLYSRTTLETFSQQLFSRDAQTIRVQGLLTALLDAQLPVQVLAEHQLHNRMAQYPLIVVSQQDSLSPAFRTELLDYARRGGKLLFIGAETTRHFAHELGVTPVGSPTTTARAVRFKRKSAVLTGLFQPVNVNAGTQSFGQISSADYGVPSATIAATTVPFGKGQLAGVYADLSLEYEKHQSTRLRDFIASLVQPLFPTPNVEVTGSHLVHVVLNRVGDKIAVNLINTGGRHADPQVFTYDEVPPLSNLTVTIRTEKKPLRIVQQPENKALPITYANGIATVTVPKLALHSILMIE